MVTKKKERDKKLPINRFKIWTKLETQRIMDLARNKTYKEIAKIMGRSHDSIERQFGRLRDRQRLLRIKEVTYANNAQ